MDTGTKRLHESSIRRGLGTRNLFSSGGQRIVGSKAKLIAIFQIDSIDFACHLSNMDFGRLAWASLKVFAGLTVVGGTVGCFLYSGADDSDPGATPSGVEASTSDAAGVAEEAGADSEGGQIGPVSCPTSLPGPSLVEIPAPNGTKYCIDSTEVTQGQYAVFLAKVTDKPGSEHASCQDNHTYAPPTDPYDSVEPKTCDVRFWTPDKTPNRPVVCVEWCDAYAYCRWAGKWLCGRIGGGSGSIEGGYDGPENTAREATLSQWYNACSQGGKTTYPYGDTYDPSACEGNTPFGDPKADVAAHAACRGSEAPYSAVFDLSGSVHELTDECAIDGCAARGGSFAATSGGTLSCETYGSVSTTRVSPDMGFRCCMDLVKP